MLRALPLGLADARNIFFARFDRMAFDVRWPEIVGAVVARKRVWDDMLYLPGLADMDLAAANVTHTARRLEYRRALSAAE